MKKISVLIPCYNDENGVQEMHTRLTDVFLNLKNYDYEIIFVDDASADSTWVKICEACREDQRVKGVRNATNFGAARNIFSAMQYASGDAAFLLMGDLQQPPEQLPEFIRYWEEGYKAVIGVESNTEDRGVKALGRKVFYRFMEMFSSKKLIQGFSYFGLYDVSILKTCSAIHDTQPYFAGIISEYVGKIKCIQTQQLPSARGKSNQSFMKKYDYAMQGFTSYTKILLRMATFLGCLVGMFAIVFSLIVLILKLMDWNAYPMGIPSILIGVFFLGAVQLFFLGIMGEYVLSINERLVDKPITVAAEKINFEEETHS